MTSKNYIWDQIKENFKTGISQSEFKTWLSQASPREINARQAVIEVPNKFIAHWLQDNYTDQIQTILRRNFNTLPEIRFTYTQPPKNVKGPRKKTIQSPDTHIINGINTLYTFNDFVTSKSNRLAYSSALSVADRSPSNYNPLYIFSELPFGKTHILNGIGNRVLQNNPSANILYLSADRFVSQFSATSEGHKKTRFWERDGGPDFLLLDDIHRFTDHTKPQVELLALCSSFLDSAKQLVVAASYSPAKIPNLLPQLRSRLEWGLITEIYPPGQSTKMKIIKKKAEKVKLVLPDDVVFFLANTTDDIYMLAQSVTSLKNYSSSHKKPIDISTVKSIIKKTLHQPNSIDPNHIQKVTAKYFNISLTDLLSNKRGRTFSYPRQIAIYLTKQLTPISLKEIGRAFGNKHHSTVIYAQNRIRKAKTQNKAVLNDINKIQKLLL